jgi:hypothetical protein
MLVYFAVWLLAGQKPVFCLNAQTQQSQVRSGSDSAIPQTYLALVLRLQANDRSLCLVKATQVSGKLVTRAGPSSKAIYEITKDDRNLAVGFLAEDPLTTRGFASSSHPTENTSQSTSATILINAPSVDLDTARHGRLGLRVYTVKSGVRIESINADMLRSLAAEGKIALQFELSRSEFASQIKRLDR